MDKFINALGPEKILFGALLFLAPVCAGFVSYFYNINMLILASLLSIVLFAGAGVTSYLLKDF